jgi:predicted DsbA family dithiol-disulfide isomerase
MIIDVFLDLVCPWCYLGTRRLYRALAERPRLRPELHWHPFLLNPDLPAEGIEHSLYLAIRFGGMARARQALGVIEETARRDGTALDLNRITHTPNTIQAHRLVALAGGHGVASRLVEDLFAAYFVEGRDIGDRAVLGELACAVGLAPELVRECLEREHERDSSLFRTDLLAQQLDLHAVPCFLFQRRYVLAGAQEPVAFLPLLDIAAVEDSAWVG